MMNLKNNKIYLSKRIIVPVFLILSIFFLRYDFVDAQASSTDSIANQMQQITDTKTQLEKQIAADEEQLKNLSTQSSSLSNAIKTLNANINKNSLDIKVTQNDIDSTGLQINQLAKDIGKNTDTINADTKVLSNLIKEVNYNDSSSLIENLLTYNDLSELWNDMQNTYSIQNNIKEKVFETKDTTNTLQNNKTQAEQKKESLLKLESSLTDQEQVLEISKDEKNTLLSTTKNSETNYEKMLADEKAKADAFDKEFAQFQSQLNLTVNTNSYPSPSHGILDWPLNSIRVTQPFGITDFSKTTTAYSGNGHNGVDFAAPIGTPAYAALGGVVEGTGDTDTVCPGASFGKWVFLQYPNGLSTIYAHLSIIKVKPGDHVSTGDIIGYTGLTGFTTGPHLHFGLYATQGSEITSYKSKVCDGTYTMPVATSTAYLDPMLYLPPLD